MSKKSQYKKRRLGKQLKRSRRMPLLATLRTHRRVQYNRYARDWRRTKLRKKIKMD
ncbi:MAG: 50S ribosomal protein L39e [Candidatus Marsarchaeota archaeon]|jgi:ribosomal protein L39E|nr:50S ribosomal protein L39e [Candidatus Marsarchaeota archaeon]